MNHKPTRREYYSLKSYFAYMKHYKLRSVLIFFCYVISDALLAVIPIFIGKLVGALAADPVQRDQAIRYVWILIICSSGHNLLWRGSEILYMKYLLPIGFAYENMLFKETIRKPYPYFVDKLSGKLSSYISSISTELRNLNDTIYYNYANQLVSLVAIAIILTSINWQTGLIFLIGILGMFAVGRHSIRNSVKYEKFAADVSSTKNAKIIDALSNFVNVKSFQKEATEIAHIESAQADTIKATKKSFAWSIFFWSTMSFFVRDLMWPVTIALNVYLFLHGQINITQLTILLSTILMFSSSIWELIWQVSQFSLRVARMEEAHQYLFGKTVVLAEREQRQPTPKPCFVKALDISNLSFAYPDKPTVSVLKDINLSLKRGEKLGIVGRSGSGKTTLTKLLLGYYPTAKDGINLDGAPINTQLLANLISYVPQDTSLFHRSIAENIAYASDEPVTHKQIVEAARQAHAHEFIEQITDGYDALVGERGVKLSAGQRQRIAIARALLDNKPFLILDEATSALDSESEVLVQEGLEALWEHKTVIAIAHRLSTLRHMDKIIVMDKGRIVEHGTHAELLKAGGAYTSLWNHQSGGFIEE